MVMQLITAVQIHIRIQGPMHIELYCVSQKKRAPTNGVPYNKFCFKEGSYIHIIECHEFQLPPVEMCFRLAR